MELLFRQTFQFLRYKPWCYLHRLFQRFPLCHLAYHAGYSNRRTTPESFKLDVFEMVILNFDIEGHHITTDRISHLTNTIRILYLPDIARIHEVFHHLLTVDWHFIMLLCSP